MNTKDITAAAELKLPTIFRGCVPLNKLKMLTSHRRPSCYIVNFDASHKIGSHWVAVCLLSNGRCNYFDASAAEPPQELQEWLARHKPVDRLTRRLANDKQCAQWALLFCMYRYRTPDVTFTGVIQILLTRLDSYKGSVAQMYNREFNLL
jgi:hypothetical protein